MISLLEQDLEVTKNLKVINETREDTYLMVHDLYTLLSICPQQDMLLSPEHKICLIYCTFSSRMLDYS